MAVQTKIQLRRDTASNWATAQTAAGATPILAAGEVGFDTTNNKFKIGDGVTLWGSLKYQSDASLLSGDATGLATITTSGDVTVGGNLTVNGSVTSINSTTITVDDKNLELASVASPTDITADGAGITVKGTTDKTFNWVDATDAWTSSEDLNLLTGKSYEINGTVVLSATQVLGRAVTNAATASTIVARDASGNFLANTITATLSGTASLASNLTGGTLNKGEIVYMSGVNTTSKLTAPTTNNVGLHYNTATNAPYWVQSTLSNTYYAATTSAQLAGVISDETGSGNLVFSTSPTLVTPTLGVATATSINKMTITAPATGSTLTIADGGTLQTSGAFAMNITVTANTSVTMPTSGTLATQAFVGSATVAQANNITGAANLIFYNSGANTTTTLAAPAGNNYILTANTTGAPFWAAASATGVTSISAGTGMSFTTITSTGSVAIDTTVVPRFANTGTFTATQTFQNASNASAGLIVKNHATQQANVFEIQYAGNTTPMVSVSNTGTLFAVTIDGGTA
jgi:hypothetical protein